MTETMITQDFYQRKLLIVVQSKFPEVLAEFKRTFLPTTSRFVNLRLHEITGVEYGAKAINAVMIPAIKGGVEVFGVFNDDLWFVDGWLEDTLRLMSEYMVVSPGYVETRNLLTFQDAVKRTEHEIGIANCLYGPTALFNTQIFKRIGIWDERYDWSIDDFDWVWRLHLNNLPSVTSKRITTAHWRGRTNNEGEPMIRRWLEVSELNKQRFYEKHGYVPYREIRRWYKEHHQYFRQFR